MISRKKFINKNLSLVCHFLMKMKQIENEIVIYRYVFCPLKVIFHILF